MRLKRLETYGFKSFADRMTFDFEQGITAVIGPNGCGKSNIVDSMKWVVGEQSAKALRGAEMADVIFNGCATRRPMAMSEVTLTLDDVGVERGLPGEEVAITRRLTRDGQSAYYLNGKPCRLRDVRELLMDTGIGTSAYSVIEQGRIGFILEASTKDRRSLIEEAAGISRYKARRKVAMRKLDRVQVDLERIGQVLGEVDKRLRTVRRQAETALRFQELQARLRDLRMVFALEEFGRLSGELGSLRERSTGIESQAAEVAAAMATAEAAATEDEAGVLGMEDRLRERERERAEAQSRRDVAAARLRDGRARLVEVDQREKDDRSALDGHSQKVGELEAEVASTERAVSEASTDEGGDSELARIYGNRKGELDELLNGIDELVGRVEERKNRQLECLREVARIDAEQGRLRSATEQLNERRKRLEDRAKDHGGGLDEALAREEAAKKTLSDGETAVTEAHTALDGLIADRERAQAEGGQMDNRLNDLRHEEGRAEVRLRLLSEYERKAEGVFKGAKSILKEMDRMPGIHGLVADCFKVAKEHELAIETALGGAAQNIITETQQSAKEAIDFLRRERRGRATFLPLDDVRERERPDRRFIKAPGVVGVGVDLIDFERRFQPAFGHLLGGLLVCETLDHAMAIRRQGCRALLVTLDGDTINPGGAMTGGRQQGSDAGGLVSRKNEIRRLEEQLKELAEQRSTTATEREAAKKRVFDATIAVEEQRKLIQKSERALGEAKGELAKAERDRLHVEEFARSFGNELKEIAGELSRLEADARDLDGQEQWFGALNRRLDGELAQLQGQLGERGGERDRLQEEINGLRVDLATSEERREALRNHLGHLRRSLQELEDSRLERERRLADHQRQRDELQHLITESERQRGEAAERCEKLGAGLDELLKERDRLRHQLEERRQELRSLSSKSRGLERERSELELKIGELSVRLEGICDRIREDYELDLAEAHEHWERPADLDLPKVRRELADTERQLGSLGPVNLAAIDELKEVEARQGFLARQHEDLAGAAAKLAEIIDSLNATSRKLFTRTYRAVRKNFQELFRKLYGGGKADLILEIGEDNDVLEAGLDIIAQPPGKQPKSITLLSGGEKALTAIALLFGVYQIKPSPFCILDEVDAPLDESNTDVYCRMLAEFCELSQFIVITHNKRTMQHADAIYGVTQRERGVSTKISVKLEEVDDHEALLTQGQGPFAD
jgi:chromosome segregation protein